MSVTVTTSHLAVSTALARDQAESLARGNARPDDGFWRDVFEKAEGGAGMAGPGVAMADEVEAAASSRRAVRAPWQAEPLGALAPTADQAGAPPAGQRVPQPVAVAARMPDGVQSGLPIGPRQQPVSPASDGIEQGVARQGEPGDVHLSRHARPGGGAPHASARLQAPVVVTVTAASSDELRVFLRGQGLTSTRALALASQAAAGADAEGGQARSVVSVALNGHTIYSTSRQESGDASGPPSLSITA